MVSTAIFAFRFASEWFRISRPALFPDRGGRRPDVVLHRPSTSGIKRAVRLPGTPAPDPRGSAGLQRAKAPSLFSPIRTPNLDALLA
jgi:hypothetical protein